MIYDEISKKLNVLKNLKVVEKKSVNPEINELRNRLKTDKTQILLKIDELKSKEIDAKTAINISKKCQSASFEEKRAVCSVLINRIIIDADGNTEIVWNI